MRDKRKYILAKKTRLISRFMRRKKRKKEKDMPITNLSIELIRIIRSLKINAFDQFSKIIVYFLQKKKEINKKRKKKT